MKRHFAPGQELPTGEFIRLSSIALAEASSLVGDKLGISGAPPDSSLTGHERLAGALPADTPLTVRHVGEAS